MKLKSLNENTISRLRTALYGLNNHGDAAAVWYNPSLDKVFISVGDWADYDRWVDAVRPIVPNIETAKEAGPGNNGWVVVRDYARIKDSFRPMTPERRLELGIDRPVVEGVVTADRANIVGVVNKIASKIARAARVIFGSDREIARLINFREPQVELTDDDGTPAVVTLRIGGRTPETLSVTVYGDGDGELKLEMSERLSRLLGVSRYSSASSVEAIDVRLSKMMSIIKRKLSHRNV